MKKLTKILLVNWLYFSKQIIEVNDVNFLTGKNGAGKSTVIDALQIVLLGETNSRNFNQAANEKSQRTLDGYLRADMDDNNPYSRKGKDFTSFIACEFLDDVEGTNFVTGVAFDCRSDGTNVEHFFIYNGTIPESGFVENGFALEYPVFRKQVKAQYSSTAEFYDTQKQYRTNMLAKWNVHSEQITRMMKKAVSFRPIVDIQKFITENICDIPEKPDIEAMQENIRAYKRHEQLAQRQEEKFAALQEIGKLFRDMQTSLDRWQQQSFLVQWAKKETLEAENQKFQAEQQDHEIQISSIGSELEHIASAIHEKEQRKTDLIAACAQSDVSREEERLRTAQNTLHIEQRRLMEQLQKDALEIKRESTVMLNLCKKTQDWKPSDALTSIVEATNAVQTAYSRFSDCSYEIFAKSSAIFEAAQDSTSSLMAAIRDGAYALKVMLDEQAAAYDQKSAVLANLRKNIKDYPKGLLSLREHLEAALREQTEQPVHIEILADVLEIAEAEEHWRRAVEGYLNTQKFYLLVAPEYYPDALCIFNQMKHAYGIGSFGIVDIGKLREREHIEPLENSLAKKVDTENDLARSYIDYLLGRVVCCSHVDQLRQFKTSITADGMLYQGYVARPIRKDLMDDAFIGRRAVALRISRIEAEIRGTEDTLRIWNPVYQTLNQFQSSHDVLFTARFVQDTVAQRQTDYLHGIEITKELEQIAEQISHLDLFWLDEQRKTIHQLETDIAHLNSQTVQLSNRQAVLQHQVHDIVWKTLPEINQALAEIEDRIADNFSPAFIREVGLPRYQQEFTRLKNASAISTNFGNRLEQTVRERDDARQKLFQKRREYAINFRPCSFQVESMLNDEYDAERKLLEDSELPQYRAKIKAAKESAVEQFQNDFLAKLKSSIDQVQDQVKSLNKALDQAQFGTDRYKFRADRNPDYADYYDMIMAPELMEGEAGLFAMPFQQKYGKLIEDLFSRIATSDDSQLNNRKQSELQENIARFTDFRTYLKFDLETTDQNGSKQLLSQTLNTKSGGETQTPFYIAVLASFAQIYQVNNLSGLANNTVRLVVFDEAFNKMDSERIVESVRLLRKMGLQAIICTPPDKLPDIMPLADRTLLVCKDKYKMHILPYGKRIENI